MEDGRLTDGKGRTVDFKNAILIATSNIGSELILTYLANKKSEAPGTKQAEGELIKLKQQATGADTERLWNNLKQELLEILKRTFRPELLNRFDEVVIFKALDEQQLKGIVRMFLDKTSHLLSAQGIIMQVDNSAVEELARISYDPEFGARPIRRTIQREIENPLTDKLLKGDFEKGSTVKLSHKDGEFIFDLA
jgi:ATP-dependent Clp protease ATP-binding subunit ClpC